MNQHACYSDVDEVKHNALLQLHRRAAGPSSATRSSLRGTATVPFARCIYDSVAEELGLPTDFQVAKARLNPYQCTGQ